MKVAIRRLLEDQIAVVVVLESGKKNDAMWHVPHMHIEKLDTVQNPFFLDGQLIPRSTISICII